MTPEQIRIAIAESLGWKADDTEDRHKDVIHQPKGHDLLRWELVTYGDEPECENVWYDRWLDCSYIPNYPNDLNACASFEQTLTEDERHAYLSKLIILPGFGLWTTITATAHQRCEAYLKCRGLWKETK